MGGYDVRCERLCVCVREENRGEREGRKGRGGKRANGKKSLRFSIKGESSG